MPFIVKNTIFPSLLDLLSPHSCRGCGTIGIPLCECCKNHIIKTRTKICPNCKKEKSTNLCEYCPDLPPIYVVSSRNSLLGSLIHDYKYHSLRALAYPLATLLDASLPQKLPEDCVLVPLPTATHHIRARGFDHTYKIAKHLNKIRCLPIEKTLIRNKNTTQVGANRSIRLSQASSAYTISPKARIDPKKTYILLDDVWTTGASALAATNILKKSGAQKIIICLLAYSN